jgi:hypothetical protein
MRKDCRECLIEMLDAERPGRAWPPSQDLHDALDIRPGPRKPEPDREEHKCAAPGVLEVGQGSFAHCAGVCD